MNVMKLAWKIYNDTGTRTFAESLKEAWKCKKEELSLHRKAIEPLKL